MKRQGGRDFMASLRKSSLVLIAMILAFVAFMAMPLTAGAWSDTDIDLPGAGTAYTGTVTGLPKLNPTVQGPSGVLTGGTYNFALTCGDCHVFKAREAHSTCTSCHTDEAGSNLNSSLAGRVPASITGCDSCHNGTIAAVVHSAANSFTAHAMDTPSSQAGCGLGVGYSGATPACHVRNLIGEHRAFNTRFGWDSTANKAMRVARDRVSPDFGCLDCHNENFKKTDATKGQCITCHSESHMKKDSASYNKMLSAHEGGVTLGVYSTYAEKFSYSSNTLLAHGLNFRDGMVIIPELAKPGDPESVIGCTAAYMCHNSANNGALALNMSVAAGVTRFRALSSTELIKQVNTCANPYGNFFCHYGSARPTTDISGSYIAMDNGMMGRDGKPGYPGYSGLVDPSPDVGGRLYEYSTYLTLDLTGHAIASDTNLTFKTSYSFADFVGTVIGGNPITTRDEGKVQARIAGSTEWTDLLTVSGDSYPWTTQTLSLGAFAGQNVEIRFASIGDLEDNYSSWGWRLQDIGLTSGGVRTYTAPTEVSTAPFTRESTGGVLAADYDDEEMSYSNYRVDPITIDAANYGFYSTAGALAPIITTDAEGKITAVDAMRAYDSSTKTLDLFTGGGENAKTIDPAILNGQTFTEAQKVILSPTFEVIPDAAFANMASLINVGTPDTILLTTPADDFGLTNLTYVGNNAFLGTGISGKLVLSNTVNYIGTGAFTNTRLTGVRLGYPAVAAASEGMSIMAFGPAGTTTIGASAFEGIGTLTSAEIGASVIDIGAYAFRNSGLVNLEMETPLPAGAVIGSSAFWVPQLLTTSPTMDEIAVNAGTTVSNIFNRTDRVPASSALSIAVLVLAAGGMTIYMRRRPAGVK